MDSKIGQSEVEFQVNSKLFNNAWRDGNLEYHFDAGIIPLAEKDARVVGNTLELL